LFRDTDGVSPRRDEQHLSAQDVRSVAFSRPPFGAQGYSEDEVDDFLDRVEATLRGAGRLTVYDIRQASFGEPRGGKLGYSEEEVDSFLDLIEQEFARRFPGSPVPAGSNGHHAPPGQINGSPVRPNGFAAPANGFAGQAGPARVPANGAAAGSNGFAAARPTPTPQPRPAADPDDGNAALPEIRIRSAADLDALDLPDAPPSVHGCDKTEVDDLIAEVADVFDGFDGITSRDVEATRFARSSNPGEGYHPRAVHMAVASILTEMRRRGL
jgi:DivIVA domain-containing protein